jgi:hypothetical protein
VPVHDFVSLIHESNGNGKHQTFCELSYRDYEYLETIPEVNTRRTTAQSMPSAGACEESSSLEITVPILSTTFVP